MHLHRAEARELTFEKPGNYIVNDNITLSGPDVHARKKSKATLVVTSKLNEYFGGYVC